MNFIAFSVAIILFGRQWIFDRLNDTKYILAIVSQGLQMPIFFSALNKAGTKVTAIVANSVAAQLGGERAVAGVQAAEVALSAFVSLFAGALSDATPARVALLSSNVIMALVTGLMVVAPVAWFSSIWAVYNLFSPFAAIVMSRVFKVELQEITLKVIQREFEDRMIARGRHAPQLERRDMNGDVPRRQPLLDLIRLHDAEQTIMSNADVLSLEGKVSAAGQSGRDLADYLFQVIGTILGGVFFAWIGKSAVVIDMTTFLIVAVSVLILAEASTGNIRPARDWFRGFPPAFRVIVGHPSAWLIFALGLLWGGSTLLHIFWAVPFVGIAYAASFAQTGQVIGNMLAAVLTQRMSDIRRLDGGFRIESFAVAGLFIAIVANLVPAVASSVAEITALNAILLFGCFVLAGFGSALSWTALTIQIVQLDEVEERSGTIQALFKMLNSLTQAVVKPVFSNTVPGLNTFGQGSLFSGMLVVMALIAFFDIVRR
ncbi:hypothetical protein [Deinococcus pimensis]|uniref:hypothetical protein n=1 Tax=Deinococcus pimensis TaxID=309888 RepID=UPI000486A9F9|nr:hypothetical protein [Deinococcus pimensis]